jgi:hypothetical protein
MKIREVESLLAAHADALNQSQGERFVSDLGHHRAVTAVTLKPFFTLAGKLKERLQPVTPRPAFVSALRARLESPPNTPNLQTRNSVLWMAGLGGLFSVISIVLIGLRLGARRPALPQR